MRAKTTEFLKILNRARPEPKAIEKKTITWVDMSAFERTSGNLQGRCSNNFLGKNSFLRLFAKLEHNNMLSETTSFYCILS